MKSSAKNNGKKWHFASETCAEAGRLSWDCFWQFPSRCQHEAPPSVAAHPAKIRSKSDALRNRGAVSIVKETFDAKGLGRNDVPSDEDFFGKRFVSGTRRVRRKSGGGKEEWVSGKIPKCYERYQRWALRDVSHTYVQGTFGRGADPRLFFMMAQAMRYLLRYQQPWFFNMAVQGLGHVGMGQGAPSAAALLLQRGGRDKGEGNTSGKSSPKVINNPSKQRMAATVYLHERGEINKFREYYSNFGCHNVRSDLLVDLATARCLGGVLGLEGRGGLVGDSGAGAVVREASSTTHNPSANFNHLGPPPSLASAPPSCRVFISGNTPSGNYKWLTERLEAANNKSSFPDANGEKKSNSGKGNNGIGINKMTIHSTWDLFGPQRRALRRPRLPSATTATGDASSSASGAPSAAAAETARWGANSPSAGWIDLYAGAAASHWACIVQSNWCRLVNWLRLTSGRAVCGGFVDLGALMLASPTLRDGYCIVNMSWPTKAFSNRIK